MSVLDLIGLNSQHIMFEFFNIFWSHSLFALFEIKFTQLHPCFLNIIQRLWIIVNNNKQFKKKKIFLIFKIKKIFTGPRGQVLDSVHPRVLRRRLRGVFAGVALTGFPQGTTRQLREGETARGAALIRLRIRLWLALLQPRRRRRRSGSLASTGLRLDLGPDRPHGNGGAVAQDPTTTQHQGRFTGRF